MISDTEASENAQGWIDSAEQSDDILNGIRNALIACAINLQRIADRLDERDSAANTAE